MLQENDVATYAAFGAGQQRLYNDSLVAEAVGIQRGQAVVQVIAPAGHAAITRGAIELRENLTLGQAIDSYTVERYVSDGKWEPLPLRNEPCLTIGNRRIQTFTGASVSRLRVSVSTLKLASGESAPPHLRSVKLFDWSSPELDGLLVAILKVKTDDEEPEPKPIQCTSASEKPNWPTCKSIRRIISHCASPFRAAWLAADVRWGVLFRPLYEQHHAELFG